VWWVASRAAPKSGEEYAAYEVQAVELILHEVFESDGDYIELPQPGK